MLTFFEFALQNREFFQNHIINPRPTALESKNHYNSFSSILDEALSYFEKKQPSLDCQKLSDRIQSLRQYLQLAFYNRQIFKKDFPHIGLLNTLKIYILSQYFHSLSLFVDLSAEGGLTVMAGKPLTCHFSNRDGFKAKLHLALNHLDNYIAGTIGLLTIYRNQQINRAVLPYIEKNIEHFRGQDLRQSQFMTLSLTAFPGTVFTMAPRLIAWATALMVGGITGYQWTRPNEKEAGASQIPLLYGELTQSIDFISKAEHPYEFYIQYFRMTLGLQTNMQVLFQRVGSQFNNDFEKALKFLKQKRGEIYD